MWPLELQAAWDALGTTGLRPRGFMFWSIASEGQVVPNTTEPLCMAWSYNKCMIILMLHTCYKIVKAELVLLLVLCVLSVEPCPKDPGNTRLRMGLHVPLHCSSLLEWLGIAW